MYVVFVAGGIASGKSTFARALEDLGAWRIDLDELSREVLSPGTEVTRAVARAFGADLLDETTGAVDRGMLAQRAFASSQSARLLEEIELPAIRQLLAEKVGRAAQARDAAACCAVEVPLLDRVGPVLELADEVIVVWCPAAERLRRAVLRGLDERDVRARMENQTDDGWLRAHADTLVPNEGSSAELADIARAWWDERQRGGWASMRGRGARHGS